ncbi:MAG: hypothetical protein NDJ89_09565 [Oligoflexia bacterium]|nr:hypothetical protein [Oligoflexia bacterium]
MDKEVPDNVKSIFDAILSRAQHFYEPAGTYERRLYVEMNSEQNLTTPGNEALLARRRADWLREIRSKCGNPGNKTWDELVRTKTPNDFAIIRRFYWHVVTDFELMVAHDYLGLRADSIEVESNRVVVVSGPIRNIMSTRSPY